MTISEAYITLPGLHDAPESFKEKNAYDDIVGPIRDVFLQYRVHEKYGISLLHRHFDISAKEGLVESGQISMPWAIEEDDGPTITVNYQEDGTFTASKVITDNNTSTRKKTETDQAMPGGKFKAWKANDGVIQLLTIGGEVGELNVSEVVMANKDLLEFDAGRSYMDREKTKKPFWKRFSKSSE